MGLGWRNKGSGVWCGDDRKTTRWTLRARRATTSETVAGPAAQTRNTVSTPASAGVSESGYITRFDTELAELLSGNDVEHLP